MCILLALIHSFNLLFCIVIKPTFLLVLRLVLKFLQLVFVMLLLIFLLLDNLLSLTYSHLVFCKDLTRFHSQM